MNFYAHQVAQLREQLYAREHLTRQVMRGKAFMDRHFPEPITLAAVADEACLSKFHFLRLFKTFYGVTPRQYLTSVRIKHAQALLRAQTSVTETCFAVGFNSVTSFAGLFKTMTGTTPTAYRKKQSSRGKNRMGFGPSRRTR